MAKELQSVWRLQAGTPLWGEEPARHTMPVPGHVKWAVKASQGPQHRYEACANAWFRPTALFAPLHFLTVSAAPDALSESTFEFPLRDSHQARSHEESNKKAVVRTADRAFRRAMAESDERNAPSAPAMMKPSHCNPSHLCAAKRRAASEYLA
jgi:hypothetical protein